MRTNYFFNGSWVGQLLIGFGLFLCSLFIEYQVLIHFITPQSLAILLCITLEGGKVAAVIWHYYLGYLGDEGYLLSIRISSAVFRSGLFLLSILCSMLFLTSHLDRPNLGRVRSARLQRLNAEKERMVSQILKYQKNQAAALDKKQQQEMTATITRSGHRIDQLEALLLKEMNNVVGGVFKGRRYREFERRLAAEKEAAAQQMAKLRAGQIRERQELHDRQARELAAVRKDFATRQQRLLSSGLADDEEVNDARIVALLGTLHTMFGAHIRPRQFVFFFSILVALLMETGIMLAFATITTAIAPVLHERHIGELEQEAIRVRSESMLAGEETRHRASMAGAQQTAENMIREAAAAGSAILHPQQDKV